jgi:hypothetical protein
MRNMQSDGQDGEPEAADQASPAGRWTVWRLDDNGNRFAINAGLTHEEAQTLATELEAKAHKQFYWCEPSRNS